MRLLIFFLMIGLAQTTGAFSQEQPPAQLEAVSAWKTELTARLNASKSPPADPVLREVVPAV